MPNSPTPPSGILVKLRPSSALRATDSSANLRPLYEPSSTGGPTNLGLSNDPQWFIADLNDSGKTAWDNAYERVADQLGVSESDVIFAEPDLVHDIYVDPNSMSQSEGLAIGEDCKPIPQDDQNGKVKGPEFAWHLTDAFTQLAKARDSVTFTERRTRIAHLDTGYYRAHVTVPVNVLRALERSFVDKDVDHNSSEDPDNKVLIDNSGHGTGTISILAGREFNGIALGGANNADILPIRIADSVVLLKTSAFAQALEYATNMQCDVATMSMGGLPSKAWREAIDRAYLEGLCLVAAAGNNANGLPTRNMVYPARYGRVLAACGVMANGAPYTGLKGLKTLEGNFGPDSNMDHALSTYTPNIPWAKFGCKEIVRENGEGTSAATPQIAAAVALWMEKYKSELPRDWRRVEAVRNALFMSAAAKGTDKKRLGNGILRAFDALGVKPRLDLKQTKSDSDSFAFLRVITGLGIADIPAREEMFNLELTQRWLRNPVLQGIIADPDTFNSNDTKTLRQFMEAIIGDDGASIALRKHVAMRYPIAVGSPVPSPFPNPVPTSAPNAAPGAVPVPAPSLPADVLAPVLRACDSQPELRDPPYRRLRVYAVDPSFSTRFATAGVNEVTLKVRWEKLEGKGPKGEYLDVQDVDATNFTYDPVDLDAPRLLARDGWAPSEGNAQFHQQMVYAVCMKTIEQFEKSLGRPVLWRPRTNPDNKFDDSIFVKQLVVKPHALRQANAFYSPQQVALLFGYFEADASDPGDHVPGQRVFSCLSHDIVAHETTHAVLDGMHRRFNEPTNPDTLALHEGFADIVALMQHMTIPNLLESEIARVRGNLEAESMLGSLAMQFGRATGGRGGLREAIGSFVNGVWTRFQPDPNDMQRKLTPHSRGAILVGAVFDAFITIYNSRVSDLLRIATGGTGMLPNGAIHPDLVKRLADEAVKSAEHVLNMCIRALDYLPPVDVTFFEYLRALITADYDLVPDDRYHYRVAFVEAFRRHGIHPAEDRTATSAAMRTLSVDTLRWQGFEWTTMQQPVRAEILKNAKSMLSQLKEYANACFYIGDREKLFTVTRGHRARLQLKLVETFKKAPEFAEALGIDPTRTFEVHELRRAMRVGQDGTHVPQVIVALTQTADVPADAVAGTPAFTFRGGSTLVVDLSVPEIKYAIKKNLNSDRRQTRTADFIRATSADPLRALFFSHDRAEPFAALHALADDGTTG